MNVEKLIEGIKAISEAMGEPEPGHYYTSLGDKLEVRGLGEEGCRKLAEVFGSEAVVKCYISGEGCPTMHAHWSAYIGKLYVSAYGGTRKATADEIAAEMGRIKKQLENCCPPEEK